MIDRVIRNQKTAPHHVRHHRLIATVIGFLLCIEKAEGNISASGQVIQSVTVDQLYYITDAGPSERLSCKLDLLV